MLVFLHFGRYGVFGALAQQPGVEFHLKLDMPCSLGDRVGGWVWLAVPLVGSRER